MWQSLAASSRSICADMRCPNGYSPVRSPPNLVRFGAGMQRERHRTERVIRVFNPGQPRLALGFLGAPKPCLVHG